MESLPSLESACIQLDQHHGVLQVTLARPTHKNALNLAMYRDLSAVLDYANQSEGVAALVLQGAGGAFTSGNDLKDFMAHAELLGSANPIVTFVYQVARFPKPMVAAVDGAAYGIGATVLLHCERVFASENSEFCFPFVPLGLVPECGASYLLPLRVGYTQASQWLMEGAPFGAQQAYEGGLIQQVIKQPQAAALEYAKKLAAYSNFAVQTTKQLMLAQHREAIEAAITQEVAAFTQALASPDFAKAAKAFFDK